MTVLILFALALLAVCATLGRGPVALVARLVLVAVAAMLLVALLSGCAPPPPPPTATVLDLQDATTPTWLWLGADHPEWASCRYEAPSALCTEP